MRVIFNEIFVYILLLKLFGYFLYYNIIVWEEWEYFVWKVLENDVSSFGNSYSECIENIKEALNLYLENDDIINIEIQSPNNYTK